MNLNKNTKQHLIETNKTFFNTILIEGIILFLITISCFSLIEEIIVERELIFIIILLIIIASIVKCIFAIRSYLNYKEFENTEDSTYLLSAIKFESHYTLASLLMFITILLYIIF